MSLGMDPVLLDRDPMLAAAVLAHGEQWRADLTACLELKRDDARRLPGIEVRVLGHRIEWPNGGGRAVHAQKWQQSFEPGRKSQSGWVATFTMEPLPETIGLALVGQTLDRVIDAEGADAWRIAEVTIVPGLHTEMKLERAAREAH